MRIRFAGQLITGGCVSCTVTVNEQLAVLPDPSVAVQLTVVVPLAKLVPEAGVQTTLTVEQLSEAVVV